MAAKLPLVALALSAVALAGCSSGGGSHTDVEMHDFAYAPASVTIQAGEKVEFHNHDSVVHTATGNGWDTGDIAEDGAKSVTFDNAGTYSFHCKYHASMTGTVIVQ